jgi:hypothetical protein
MSVKTHTHTHTHIEGYFSKEIVSGMHRVTQNSVGSRVNFSFRNCTKYDSLFERRVVG